MRFSIDFEWAVDEAGYELIPAASVPIDKEATPVTLLTSLVANREVRLDHIVPRSGRLRKYRPFDHFAGLYKIFARTAQTREGFLDFVNKFGPLTSDGNRESGEDVIYGMTLAQTMREILLGCENHDTEYFERYGKGGLGWSRLDVILAWNPDTQRPRFVYRPPMLVNALMLELGRDVTSDTQIRQCAHCGDWFEAGVGSGRRADARFCCDAHRIVFNSLKRTKGR